MGVPGNANALLLRSAAAAGGYQVSRSLRFNSSDSAYLSRTPASAGNRKTWTWAGWVKRSALGNQTIVDVLDGQAGQPRGGIYFTSGDNLQITFNSSGASWDSNVVTTAVFRDVSAWYHLLIAFDVTQSTASDRVKVYVNGAQLTAFSTATYPTNTDQPINNTVQHRIGLLYGGTLGLNGYLAECYLIDGQQLTPSSFTEVSATTGQLIPKAYTGSYGTNGFRLPFSDNSGTTSTTLGKDSAGSNNWTPNNFSVAAGAGNDSLVDTPVSSGTDTGAGGEVRGNYATLNPLSSGGTLSNGNLNWVQTAFAIRCAFGTIAQSSEKWYYEVTVNTQAEQVNTRFGISRSTNPSAYPDGYYYIASAQKQDRNASSTTSYGATFGVGDIIGVAYDLTAGTIVFYKNGVSQGTAFTTLGSYPGNYAPACFTDGNSSINVNYDFNFGQRPFAYTAPSGFKALCDTNLPAPVVAKPNTVMDVVTYTGTGASRSITGLGFSPDFVWIKERGAAGGHNSYDTVRGASVYLASESTNAEGTDTDALTAFNSNGFSLGSGYTVKSANGSGRSYVAWTWDAGSSTVTNTQGSITSSVRANASAGFSVVTYTGNGATTTQTIGHGLNVSLGMVIVKARDSGSNDMGWGVSHTSVAAPNYLYLNRTDAAANAGPAQGQPSIGSGSTFSILAGTAPGTNNFNANGIKYVAYCFAPVTGYSSFGSYTGNGSADGPFVYTGFRPRWILFKCSSAVAYWGIYDAVRNTYNAVNLGLYPNDSIAEISDQPFDFLSNGFKVRGTTAFVNSNAATYVWAAFAESPFAYSRAR